ncbi:heat shock protein 60 [Emiliania huxleyi CCMP1516]|uniref:Uncharacterized protein n=2 Tax=Emiliania huxleyi TaxID=2903 RepID=A0A0D3IVH9_EMIH1|nr:heat shock protein 60 [Emiliania huxleyi CCMP1516]EOD15264.1 heat shock protein 60 [Emiliania huxleyi CCMP1516]|eukprot:XP_005767693.1 heat shock protein 60 [Emiliania huxleyi CCMP1516]
MMARKVLYAGEAREALMAGVNKVADAVKVTIGPRGRNVVIRPTGKMPAVVNDGVTIAGEVNLESIPENVGVKLLLQAASQTDSRAGDGTTTATVLTQAIMREGIRLTSSGHNAVALQKGLLKAAAFFSAKIRELAEPVTTYEQYKQIASISANSDELGAHTADAIIKALPQVGLDGATIIEDGVEMHDEVTVSEGMELEARRLCLAAGLPRRLVCTLPAPCLQVGWLSELLVKEKETLSTTLEEPLVLVTDIKLTTVNELLPVLEAVVEAKRPLLLIAKDVVMEALSALILNLDRGVLDVCAVKCPGFGDVQKAFLADICTFSGATLITDELKMKVEEATLAQLGSLSRVKVEKAKTLLVSDGTHQADVDARVEELKGLKEQLVQQSNKEFEVQRIEQRIHKLRAAIARIKVGAPTETEVVDKKLRYEDAINAVRGAIVEGMVPGGGACLAYVTRFADEARAAIPDPDERVAVDVLVAAMGAPVMQIADNAGLLGALVREKVADHDWGYGFNAKTLHLLGACLQAGVCDPASVTTWALENAASITGSMLTTEALVYDPERDPMEDEANFEPEVTTGMRSDVEDYMW